jgi:nitrite reductase (NADH) large subunit
MKLVIIGNGVAGVTTARFVAERDPSADITMYTDECYPYYPRPRLIELLAGQVTPEKMPFYPPEWYEQRGIRTVFGCPVRQLVPGEHKIVLCDGGAVSYDKLVLATGASAWVPPISGASLERVLTLRSMRDALNLHNLAQGSKHAVVLGGGLLGLDTSSALRAHQLKVTVVELFSRLLPRQLDAQGASLLGKILANQGIDVVTSDSCTLIEGPGRAEKVHLKSGNHLETDMVVISAGVRPRMVLAQEAGLNCNHGVVVDEMLLTSDPAIYAVGDVAEFKSRVWGIIPAALAQARVAAAQISGESHTLYQDIVPSTTLKVTGIDLTSIGEVNPEGDDHAEIRQIDVDAGVYKKLVIRNDRVTGAIIMGSRASLRTINRFIDGQLKISANTDLLLKEGFDRAELESAVAR